MIDIDWNKSLLIRRGQDLAVRLCEVHFLIRCVMKSFEELQCWKQSASIRRALSKLVKEFPKEEEYRLVDQIVRASRSVTANLAEGYGRFHYQEYVQFCRQSRGSLYEIVDHLITAYDEGLIDETQLKDLRSDIEHCVRILNGFINYLLKAKDKSLITDHR